MANETTTQRFTPGPWKQTDGDIYGLYIEANRVPVACAFDLDGKPVEVIEANARLIAAAPDLLEALIALRRWVEAVHPTHGDVHCLLCRTVTDPQVAMVKGHVNHHDDCPMKLTVSAIEKAGQS